MDNISVSLYKAYENYFDIGAAVSTSVIATHRNLIVQHFSSITAENEMKFALVHPTKNSYKFDAADSLVDFAKENGKKVRGHTLVWHNQTPDWVFEDDNGHPVSRKQLLERMKDHIDTVVGRYKGRIYCWDVVNEAIEDKQEDFLRKTKWHEIIGEDYLAKAFEYAHEADPDALLFYNDYNETNPQKRDKIIKLIKNLLDRGVPVHGFGMQAHWNIYDQSLDEIKSAIEKYASLGIKLQITELDVSVYRWGEGYVDLKVPAESMMELQAQKYEAIFKLFREYRDVITNVTFWGVADDRTWLDNFPVKGRKNWPLIFDENHQPKNSFWKIAEF